MAYNQLMREARKTHAQRDKSDHANGFATPSDGPIVEHIRTAMMAIEIGMKTKDWGTVAEGQAMLEVVILRLSA